jgi:ADP-ribose pyrophosphatase
MAKKKKDTAQSPRLKPVAPKKVKFAEKKSKAAKPKKPQIKKPKAAKAARLKTSKTATARKTKTTKPKKTKANKRKSPALPLVTTVETAQVLSSECVFDGPLFRVLRDKLIEPGGKESSRDIIRHNGSVVILAIDNAGKNKKDPWIVVERQYRHAANQFLWELPAGKLEAGEDPLAGAKRELEEETGYQAKKWKPLVEYYASPGFLGESMKVYLAEGLVAGNAHPEDDEEIEIRLVKLSELLKMIEKGAILDGKTLTSVLLFTRLGTGRRKK